VGLDKHGRPQFRNLLFHRGEPSFIAFDLLYDRGKDLRDEQVLEERRRSVGCSVTSRGMNRFCMRITSIKGNVKENSSPSTGS
jgi:ATP-dependent DNA ligase